MKKSSNRLLIIVLGCLYLYLTSTISAMEIGGFDINMENGENSSWQWQEEQHWNQSSWENTWESSWESSWQTGDNASETTEQNDQMQDNRYKDNSDIGNGTQDNTQQWNDIQQSSNDWNNGNQWDSNSQGYNNSQNNNTQDNNIQNNNSAWNDQSQTDNKIQTAPQTDSGSPVKTPEETSPTSTPMPTPQPTKNPKPTKTPKPTQTPTPKPSKKKNKKKQNKVKKIENKSTDNFKELQNTDAQLDTVKYAHAKDEPVTFQCTQNPDNSHIPQIQILSQGSVQILSVCLNGTECPWHWEEDKVVSDTEADGDQNKIELLAVSQGGKLIKMNPRIFSS